MNRPIVVVSGALMLATFGACAPGKTPDLGLADPRGTCNTATAYATTRGEANARRYALAGLDLEMRDLKGDFVRAGFRGVRETRRDVVCEPYALTGLGSDVYHCAAAARVCGR